MRNLQQQLNSLKAPKIAPQVDMSNFFSQMDKAESYATKGRIGKLFSGVDFGSIGRQAGSQYATSFMAGLGPIGGAASDLALAIGPIGLAAGVAAAGIALIGAKSVQAAAAWESMATSIGRTTGLEGKNLTSLMDSLQDLRMEMGITREAAAGLVEQAGSIGVGQAWLDKGDIVAYKNELLDFARSTAMLQGAWGMSAEATSAGIGKMGSVTIGAWNAQRRAMGEQELSWSDYAESVGGKVDSLANTMGSSEEEIVTAMRNASSAVASFAPTEETYGKWLALSSFLIDTGASAGEAGTQIERMAKGAKQHGAELGAILGMDKPQFQAALKEDFVGTFQSIAKKLARMPEGDRPDMIKLLGIEGSGAMDKMIADIKSGVGKLNEAIKLDPSNITEGFEKVADDANTAFARIGQAAQVSFEQLGGVILPIVTDIANAVADAWQGMNVAGSEMWKAGAGIVENLSQGNLGDFALNGEWYNVSLSGIHKKTAEEIAAGAKQGAASASDAVADNLASSISEKVASELEEAAIEFDAKQEAYIKSHPGGMSVSNLYDTGEKSPITGKTIYKEGKPRIIGGSDGSKHEYEGLWGRGSGTIVADEEGINYKIYYSTDKFGTTSYLYIDGQLMGETRETSSKEAAIQDLFSQASARDKLTETLSLKLQGRGGEAALITETVDVELDFDVDVATKNAREELGKFSQNMDWGEYLFGDMENTVLGEMEWASNIGDEYVKAAVDNIGSALQEVSLENYPKLVTGIEALNQKYGDMWSGFGPRSDVYTKLQSQYADAVLAGVIDAKDLMKAQSTETSTLLSDILYDGSVWGAERGALEARKILLGLLKERYPVDFEASGLDKLLSQIEDTLAGKKIEIEVQAKTIWEDWTSAAYREKFLADNPQLSALITPSQGDDWSDAIGQMAEDAENGDQVAKAALQDWQIAVQGFSDGTISSMGYASEALYDLIQLYPELGRSGSWLRSFMGDYQSKVMAGLPETEKGTYFPYTYSIWNPESNKGSMWGTPSYEDITVDQIESLDQIESPVTVNEMGAMAGAVMGAKLATDTLSGKATQMQPNLATTATESQNATSHLTGIESHTSSMVGLLSSIDGKIGALAGSKSASNLPSVSDFVGSGSIGNSSSTGLGSIAGKIKGGGIKGLFSAANAAYQDGGVPAQSGMAWLDKGDVVIGPNSSIASKGNLPAAADTASASLTKLAGAVDKSSAAYQTTWRWFEDYAYEITAPTSYKWSKYPDEPDVNVKGNVPVAWLSEGQPTGMDYIDAELQEVIAKSIGNSQVKPWFARGYEAQPEWWTEAATSLSPKYADEWSAPKGGEVAKPPSGQTAIVETAARQQGLTIADVWNSIHGESFTEGCIAANTPDKSLIYTPSARAIAEAGRTWGKESTEAWLYLHGEAFTEGCISTAPPDKLLHFTPSAKLLEEMARAQGAWGSQLVGNVGGVSAASPDGLAQSIEDNTESLKSIFPVLRILNANTSKGSSELAANTQAMKGLGQDSVLSRLGGAANAKTGSAMAWGTGTPNVSDALTTASIWSAIYDDSGTCIAYVKPDPSLNFTPGKEYLPGGKWYHGNQTVGRTIGQSYGDQALQEMYSYSEGSDASDAINEASTAASKSSTQTNSLLAGLNTRTDKSNTTAAKSDTTLDKIEANTGYTVAGIMAMSWGGGAYGSYGSSGSGSSIIGLANRGGGTYWGGTSISGGGSWIAASPGPAPGSSTAAWMNAGARAVGGSNAVQWAEGGFADRATLGVFGEAGREAFVPISDRAAGLRILPQVMRELGVAAFADGGIVQSQSITGSGAVSSTLGQTVVNGVATSQYASHSGGEPTVAMGDIHLTIQGDVGRTQIRDMIAQLRQEWKEERNALVRTLKQARTGGHY